MAAQGSAAKAILYAFVANLGIAVAKLAASLYTNSGSMLAEAIHSFADAGNQVLLWLGLKQSQQPPDEKHPLGYGKLSYFWSFIVAILLFSMGGLFSIYEGWHKLHEPEVLNKPWVALVVLGIAMLLESGSLYGALREIKKIRGAKRLGQWLRTTRNAELVVVFGEDVAALVGLGIAFAFVALATIMNDPRLDAIGSIAIGIVLIIVSIFVAIRIRGLLVGRSAEDELQAGIRDEIARHAAIESLLNAITLQLGPQVMLAAKIKMRTGMPIDQAVAEINALEQAIKARFPEIAWSFIEPDTSD